MMSSPRFLPFLALESENIEALPLFSHGPISFTVLDGSAPACFLFCCGVNLT